MKKLTFDEYFLSEKVDTNNKKKCLELINDLNFRDALQIAMRSAWDYSSKIETAELKEKISELNSVFENGEEKYLELLVERDTLKETIKRLEKENEDLRENNRINGLYNE